MVNTQNNTESFQAENRAGAVQRKYGQKHLCADDGRAPEWDVRVFDAQEDVPRS